MTTRAMGMGAGWHWLVRAANLGGSNPGAIFGGAALLVVVVVVAALLISMVAGGLLMAGGEPSLTSMLVLNVVITLPVLLLMACLMVGYLRTIDAVESGRPASATGVLAGFRELGTSLQAFLFVVVVAIVQNVVLALLVSALAPEVATLYAQLLQASPTAPPPQLTEAPDGLFSIMALVWLLSMFTLAVQAVGLGEIALRGRRAFPALGTGVTGAAKNLLPLLLLMLIGIAIALVAVLVVFVLALLVGLLMKAVGAWIAFVVAIPLYLAAVLMMIVIAFGVMYFMWRDIAGDDLPPMAGTPADIGTSGDRLEL